MVAKLDFTPPRLQTRRLRRVAQDIVERPGHYAQWDFLHNPDLPDRRVPSLKDLDTPQHCGTWMCIAGYAVARYSPGTPERKIPKEAMRVLGLTLPEANKLFSPHFGQRFYDFVTPRRVPGAIEEFIDVPGAIEEFIKWVKVDRKAAKAELRKARRLADSRPLPGQMAY